ncbi:MAG: prephenate dehydrogenase, partial [Candidatus Saccharicenans sp.]
GVKKADFIVLCSPVEEIKKQIRKIGPLLNENQILFDTGSTKKEIVREMENFPDKCMVGGHPMAGTVKMGEKAWNPELFLGKPFFLCRVQSRRSSKGLKQVREIIVSLGAQPIEISAERHDQNVALTSQLPYLLSLALFSLFLKKSNQQKRINSFLATGFLGATRLCLTPPTMGQSMLRSNKENVLQLADEFIREFKFLEKCLQEERGEDFLFLVNAEAEKRRKRYEKAFPGN